MTAILARTGVRPTTVSRRFADTKLTLSQYTRRTLSAMASGRSAAVAADVKLFSSANHATATYVRSHAHWLAGLDLTGYPVYTDDAGGSTGGDSIHLGAMITPRHMFAAAHYHAIVGDMLRFVTRDNVVIERTVADQLSFGPVGNDQIVLKLSADLPSTIRPFEVMPLTWYPTYWAYNHERIAAFGPDRELKIHAYDAYSKNDAIAALAMTGLIEAARSGVYEQYVGGDSGNPIFTIVNGSPVLLATAWNAYGGPTLVAVQSQCAGPFLTDLNTALTTLGGGYQASPVNLSCFKTL